MKTIKQLKNINKKYSLKEIIADLIYTADWEIRPKPVNGIDTFYMINEDDVVQEIIIAVFEARDIIPHETEYFDEGQQ